MEKKSVISSYQIVLLLVLSRLLFATIYIAPLKAGNSIQDLLPALGVGFLTNLVAAVPLLLLLRRHPGHDLVECASKILGRAGGVAAAILYGAFFLAYASWITGTYDNYFSNAVVAEASPGSLNILMLLICVYGAYKGIETIARFGSVTAILYILAMLLICLVLIPEVDPGLLKPMFYGGPGLLLRASMTNYTLGVQAVLLGFLAAFQKQGKSIGKAYAAWDAVSTVLLGILLFFIVTVTGAAGARWFDALQFLSTIFSISVFERLDGIMLVPWALSVILSTTFYIYLTVNCLCKVGLNKFRLPLTVFAGIAVYFAAPLLSSSFSLVVPLFTTPIAASVTTLLLVVIPLFLLITDIVKERILQSDANLR